MKKILIPIFLFTLAALAGCSKDLSNGSNTNTPLFSGNFVDNSSRITIGDHTPGDTKAPIYWNQTDEIGIYANYTGKDSNSNNNIQYVATTTTQAAATNFKPYSPTSFIDIPIGTQGNIDYYAYHPYNSSVGTNYTKIPSPINSKQSYNALAGGNNVFMTAKASSSATNVELQFANAFSLIYVGVKGTAKIDKITIENELSPMSSDGGFIDLTKAPKAGTSDVDFTNNGFITEQTESNFVSIGFDAPLQLKSEITWIPIMVFPFYYDAGLALHVTISGIDKDGKPVSIEKKSIGSNPNEDEGFVKTNAILYMSLKEINAVDLGQ